MRNLSALIVDDESENITLIKLYLKKYFKDINTIFVASNFEDGTNLFLENRPDILFFDIMLNDGYTAFDMLDNYHLGSTQVIFITGNEKFAIKALNIDNIAAFVLKPIKLDEFINAVSRTISKFASYDNKVDLSTKNNVSDYIAVSSINKIDLLLEQDIISCTADGNYTIFQTKNNKYISSKNLKQYQKLLNCNSFFRIHHKHIINLKHIKEINKVDGFYCLMQNGEALPVSKRNQESFNRFIRIKIS